MSQLYNVFGGQIEIYDRVSESKQSYVGRSTNGSRMDLRLWKNRKFGYDYYGVFTQLYNTEHTVTCPLEAEKIAYAQISSVTSKCHDIVQVMWGRKVDAENLVDRETGR